MFSLKSFSQTQKTHFIPDSLKDKSYAELYNKYLFHNNNNDTLNSLFYAKMYLHKGKNERDTVRIANGYSQSLAISNRLTSIMYSDSIIELTKNLNHHVYPGYAYMIKGMDYYNLSEYKKALNNYLIAQKYAESHNNKQHFFYINNGIAQIKLVWGNYNEAKVIFKSQLEYLKNNRGDPLHNENYFSNLHSLSNAHIQLKELDSALFITNKELKKSLKKKDDYWYYNFVKQSGYILYDKKDYLKALDSINKGAISDELPNEHLNTNYYKASIYYNLDQKEKALFYYKKADSIFDLYPNRILQEVRNLQEYFVKHYSKKQDPTNQLKYIDRLLHVDSIMDSYKKNLNETIIKEYDRPRLLAEKQNIINTLQKDKAKSKTKIIGLFIGLVIVVLLAIRFYYSKYIYKKRFNALINKKQEEVIIKDKTPLEGFSKELIGSILEQLEAFEDNKRFLDEKTTLGNLANMFNTNSSYLSKVINHYNGKNFSTYLSDLRIEHCINTLKTDKILRSYTIKAIATEMGFKNSESFSKAFFKKTGIYPSFFIKQIEKENTTIQ